MSNSNVAEGSSSHPALAELHQIEEALREDSRGIGDLLRENVASQMLRRVYIKTLITEVEGHLYAFKQAMLAFEEIFCTGPRLPRSMDSRILLYSEPERMVLRERQYKLSGSTAKEVHLIMPLDANLRFAFATFQRALAIPGEEVTSGPGYESLVNAQKIRNRLTHPKSVSSLLVTEADLDEAEQGVDWYFSVIEVLRTRAATESIFHRHFQAAPPSITTSVSQLVEAGAVFSGAGYDFLVGLMKQIGRQTWFIWPAASEDPLSARFFFANIFSSSTDGLDIDFFHKTNGKIGQLLPIRRAIADKAEQKKLFEQHRAWRKRTSEDLALRLAIETRAAELAKEFYGVGIPDFTVFDTPPPIT